MTAPRTTESLDGHVYGLQAVSWQDGEVFDPELTKIGWTRREVSARVEEMQRSMGAGAFHKLEIAFAVPVRSSAVERDVHHILAQQGRRLQSGPAREWFRISPQEAEALVRDVAAGRRKVDPATRAPRSAVATGRRGRPKELETTPIRAAALEEMRALAARGASRKGVPGGRWGAAATALAVELDVSKEAALVLLDEMFAKGGE